MLIFITSKPKQDPWSPISVATRCELQIFKSGVLDFFLENIYLYYPDLFPICIADHLDVFSFGLHHGSSSEVCY